MSARSGSKFRNFLIACLVLVCAGCHEIGSVSGQHTLVDVEALFAVEGSFTPQAVYLVGPNEKYSYFYPEELGTGGIELHPIITWGNATLCHPFFYEGLLKHFASHGFVVVAANDPFVGSGVEMLEALDWMIGRHYDESSLFFGLLDVDNAGAVGHSQGGGGAINAGNDPRVVCVVPITPIPGDLSGLHGPMFIAAAGEDVLVPLIWIASAIYNPSHVPTIFGVLDGAGHIDPLGHGDGFRGYVTAFLGSCLFEDPVASVAFFEGCSICNDPDWTVKRKHIQPD